MGVSCINGPFDKNKKTVRKIPLSKAIEYAKACLCNSESKNSVCFLVAARVVTPELMASECNLN